MQFACADPVSGSAAGQLLYMCICELLHVLISCVILGVLWLLSSTTSFTLVAVVFNAGIHHHIVACVFEEHKAVGVIKLV